MLVNIPNVNLMLTNKVNLRVPILFLTKIAPGQQLWM